MMRHRIYVIFSKPVGTRGLWKASKVWSGKIHFWSLLTFLH